MNEGRKVAALPALLEKLNNLISSNMHKTKMGRKQTKQPKQL